MDSFACAAAAILLTCHLCSFVGLTHSARCRAAIEKYIVTIQSGSDKYSQEGTAVSLPAALLDARQARSPKVPG